MKNAVSIALFCTLLGGASYWVSYWAFSTYARASFEKKDNAGVTLQKITNRQQLEKLLPFNYLFGYRHWAKFEPLFPSLSTAVYNRYTFTVASSKPVGKLIRSAIARNLYPSIPKQVIYSYLKIGQFDRNGILKNSSLPYLNFSLFGYQDKHALQNNRVLHVAKILIKRGANIDGVDNRSGRSSLHEAILMNHSEVISFLLRHKANADLRVNSPTSKFHKMNALEIAQFMEKASPGENYAEIIKTLTLHKLRIKNLTR